MSWGPKRFDLINEIARRIDARTYLEIGVSGGETFEAVKVANKVGVDPADGSAATIHQESDLYFRELAPEVRFDLVFVDGLHTREQAAKDIRNALARLSPNGAIVVHDCDPPTAEAASPVAVPGVWCGDVWRAWVDFRATAGPLGRAAFVVDADLGCGVIGGPWVQREARAPALAGAEASFERFRSLRTDWLNLVTVDRFHEVIAG